MSPSRRPELRQGLSKTALFTLAFGSMIGVGWVTAMGFWLSQAGPGGAALAFLAGGAIMILIGLCYAELTPMLPVAGGEVAYAYASSGVGRAFVVGWALAFGYLSVSAFEAISVGYVLSYLIPAIDRWPLYSVAAQTVYGSHLILGLGLTAAVTWVNYRGGAFAGRLQTILTGLFILLTSAFVLCGFANGSIENARPFFPATEGLETWTGVLAVLVTAPFWFVGFDTIPQAAEEADAEVPPRDLGLAILIAIAGAALFYAVLILSVAFAAPWRLSVAAPLPTAAAFESALGSSWMARLVLLSALVGLLTSWNGFFLAGSRVLFAMGRGLLISGRLGATHPRFGSPDAAVLFSGAVTALGSLLGRGGLAPLVNVGSFAIALAFLGVALSTLELRRSRPDLRRPYKPPGGLWPARAACLGAAGLLAAMVVPASPAALTWPLEWMMLSLVAAVGAIAWAMGAPTRRQASPAERDHRILSHP